MWSAELNYQELKRNARQLGRNFEDLNEEIAAFKKLLKSDERKGDLKFLVKNEKLLRKNKKALKRNKRALTDFIALIAKEAARGNAAVLAVELEEKYARLQLANARLQANAARLKLNKERQKAARKAKK